MKASEKTPTMNAYVSGLGASKRMVVWDTNIAKETTPEIVSDVGHEMGHYVLGHVWKGLLFQAAVFFVLLYLGFRSIGWMLGRWGAGWRIRGLDDWASLPALLLLLIDFQFCLRPDFERLQPAHRASGGRVRSGGHARSDSECGPGGGRFVSSRRRILARRSRSESRERFPVLRPSADFRSSAAVPYL